MEPNRTAKWSGRRQFLINGASLAGLAMVPSGWATVGARGSEAPQTAAPTNAMGDMNALEWNLYGRRSRFVTTTRLLRTESHMDPLMRLAPLPNPPRPENLSPIDEQLGIITPSSLHYTTNHYYGI